MSFIEMSEGGEDADAVEETGEVQVESILESNEYVGVGDQGGYSNTIIPRL